MRAFVPLLLLIISVVGGYAIINPIYGEVKSLSADAVQYKEAIKKGKEFDLKIGNLTVQKDELPSEDVERLEKMIPNNVDNVRLIIEIDTLAKKYTNGIRNIKVAELKAPTSASERARRSESTFETINLSFSVQMTYDQFTMFLKDLESNLRLADVTSLSFIPVDTGSIYEFNISMKTYWLKAQ